MLRTENLSYSYAAVRSALRGVSIELRRGELTAIIGANGSGKSTLLKAIARVIDPDRGNVFIDGTPIAEVAPKEYARRIGYLPQELDVPFPMRAFDVVLSGRSAHLGRWQWDRPEDVARAEAALVECDATSLRDRLMFEMSGGERKRVLLARVLAGDPDAVLLDEPLASLDAQHMQQLTTMMQRLTAAGKCVVFVSHDFNWAAASAQRVVAMAAGRIVADGTVDEVLTGEIMREHFAFEAEVLRGDDGRRWIVPRSPAK